MGFGVQRYLPTLESRGGFQANRAAEPKGWGDRGERQQRQQWEDFFLEGISRKVTKNTDSIFFFLGGVPTFFGFFWCFWQGQGITSAHGQGALCSYGSILQRFSVLRHGTYWSKWARICKRNEQTAPRKLAPFCAQIPWDPDYFLDLEFKRVVST